MKHKINFIVLPDENLNRLTSEEENLLIGGDICHELVVCAPGHGSYCWNHTDEACKSPGGGCGETVYCTGRSEIPSCEKLSCPKFSEICFVHV